MEFGKMSNKFNRKRERGGAGVKMLLVLVVLLSAAHAGFNYVPVAYNGESFKQEMQTLVVQSWAMPNLGSGTTVPPADALKNRVRKAADANGVPQNAQIMVKPAKEGMQVRVAYSQQVPILPFGIYTYDYNFDHTATPTGFLMKQ